MFIGTFGISGTKIVTRGPIECQVCVGRNKQSMMNFPYIFDTKFGVAVGRKL